MDPAEGKPLVWAGSTCPTCTCAQTTAGSGSSEPKAAATRRLGPTLLQGDGQVRLLVRCTPRNRGCWGTSHPLHRPNEHGC